MAERKFSRRDFFKVVGLTGAGWVASTIIRRGEVFQSKIVEIETDSAYFYPSYEKHSEPIATAEFRKLPRFDLYLYEGASIPSQDYRKRDARDLLTLHTPNTSIYRIPRDHFKIFAENNTWITIEGWKVPDSFWTEFMFNSKIESTGALVGYLLYGSLRDGLKNAVTSAELKFFDKTAAIGISWLSGVWITQAGGYAQLAFGNKAEKNAFQRVAARLGAISSHFHPEDDVTFFRNLLFARKMTFLAEELGNELVNKPRIGFTVGAGHTGIEDFLQADKRLTMYLLGLYSGKHYEQITDLNGGAESFCTSVVYCPDLDIPIKRFFVDKELQELIEVKTRGI